jgi:hypothetical protein
MTATLLAPVTGDVDLLLAGHVRGLLAMMHGHVTAPAGRMDLIGAAPTLRRLLRIPQLDELLPGGPSCR